MIVLQALLYPGRSSKASPVLFTGCKNSLDATSMSRQLFKIRSFAQALPDTAAVL